MLTKTSPAALSSAETTIAVAALKREIVALERRACMASRAGADALVAGFLAAKAEARAELAALVGAAS